MNAGKPQTISVTFTRDELCGKRNPQGNELLAGQAIFSKLRAKGVPVIGVLGVLAVEWGVLTIEHQDGLDGDEWAWSWTGEPMQKDWIAKCSKPGAVLVLRKPLREMIEEEEEL